MERPTDPSDRLAIIIAIEDYINKLKIPSVQYARNDAAAFKLLLMEHMDFLEEEIVFWQDSFAVKHYLENELPHYIGGLSKGSRFVFYYAGHGFFQEGVNKITCWDSHPDNLPGTTVSLEQVLFKPLRESGCEQNLVFLDCCASYLTDQLGSRDIIGEMSEREFEAFAKQSQYDALFASCSPGEKSSSSSKLSHGIWTYYLIQALSGKDPGAIIKGNFITSNSLQNYLSHSVQKFIREERTAYSKQTPYAKVGAANEFLIREIPAPKMEVDIRRPSIELNFSSARLRKVSATSIKKAGGFKSGDRVPKFISSTTQKFVQNVFLEETKSEVQAIYTATKKVFGLRSQDIKYDCTREGGFVQSSFFEFNISVEQSNDNPELALITREIYPKVSLESLPPDFDSIFPVGIDELIIPISGPVDFKDLVKKFENLADQDGGNLSDNAMDGRIEYITKNHTLVIIDTVSEELIVTSNYPMKAMDLIRNSIADIQLLSQQEIKLLI